MRSDVVVQIIDHLCLFNLYVDAADALSSADDKILTHLS